MVQLNISADYNRLCMLNKKVMKLFKGSSMCDIGIKGVNSQLRHFLLNYFVHKTGKHLSRYKFLRCKNMITPFRIFMT